MVTIAKAASRISGVPSGISGVGEGEGEGDGLGDGEGDGEGVRVGVGVGVGIGGAAGFGPVKKGTKLTVPKLKSFLKSKIVRLIDYVSVVPHQL